MRIARVALSLLATLALASCATGGPPAATRIPDDLDSYVTTQMARRRVPGLSLAIIQDGRIVETRAYGVTEQGGGAPVTPSTLFQAGSISKSVAALGALRLVEQGKLSLDGDVNATLKTWKVPANDLTAARPVTLRGILSHSAGLTVHGFPGYAVDEPLPTLVQVLDGTRPANTAAIRVDVAPGAQWRYSGGGYTVMQQMMLDVTGQSFPALMRQTVLAPIGMTSSSYEQPLPPGMAAATAAGYYGDRTPVKGRWHIYPEMAAAGLWTTPTDLARFAIEVQQAYAGKSSRVISPAMARQMLTDQKNQDGLGVFLLGTGPALLFNHGGRDEGFDASLTASAETGQGLAIMINANDNSSMIGRIGRFVANKYHWPNASSYVPPAAVANAPSPAALERIAGRYELRPNAMITLIPENGRLFSYSDGGLDEEFIPTGEDSFASADRNVRFAVTRDGGGAVTGLTWTAAGSDRAVPRVGPLIRDLARQGDSDPALTAKVYATLRLLGQGGQPVASAEALTTGARRDFSGGPWPVAQGVRGLTFIASQDVSSRGLERHDGKVDRILYYTMSMPTGDRALLVHLTREGLITDVDDVDL